MTPNRDPAAIVAHDLFTAFGAGPGPAWQALLEGRTGFSPCLRFRNRNLENYYAALAPELNGETDPSGFLLNALAPSILPFAGRAELFLAATVGEIEYLDDSGINAPWIPCWSARFASSGWNGAWRFPRPAPRATRRSAVPAPFSPPEGSAVPPFSDPTTFPSSFFPDSPR